MLKDIPFNSKLKVQDSHKTFVQSHKAFVTLNIAHSTVHTTHYIISAKHYLLTLHTVHFTTLNNKKDNKTKKYVT